MESLKPKRKERKEGKNRKKMPEDSNTPNDIPTPTVMPENGKGPMSSGRWKKFDKKWQNYTAAGFVLLFAGWGVYMLVASFAATPTATKSWSTASDWNSGALSNAVVAGNSVTLDSITKPVPTPTSSPTPSNGTIVVQNNSSSSITDSYGSKWTVKNGLVSRNGSRWAASYTKNVVQIAYVNNIIWQENSSNLWWYWNGRGWSGGNGIHTSPLTPSTGGTGTSTSYVPNGSVTLTFNAAATATWDTLTYSATTPTGTTVAVQARTSSDGATWSAWTGDVSKAAASRYIQIQANLATTNLTSTPSLTGVTLTYTPPAGAKPTVSIAAANSSLTSGQTTTVTWSTTNATACTASGAWSGNVGTSGSKSTGNLTATSTYSLNCTGANGSATGSTTVTVTPAPGGSGGSGSGTGTGFITTKGMQLMQNGKQYKSLGFNFSPVGSCWNTNWTTAQMDQFFQNVPTNSIARFFAPPGGTDSASFVQSIVKEADKYNVHLLIALSVEGVYGQCDAADSDSTSSGKTAAYYTDAVKAGSPYANWVKSVVTPLANDPGVAMWEIANEPWHGGATIDQIGGASAAANYTNAAASIIRAAETAGAGSPKQLITLGPADIGETGGVSGMEQIFKNIDVVDDHDYSGDLGGATSYVSNEFPELQQIAQALNKPYMVDETGVEAGSNCSSTNIQNAWDNQSAGLSLQGRVNFLVTQKATDYFKGGASSVGFWLYTTPGQQGSGCNYENITPSDPIMAAVKNYSIP